MVVLLALALLLIVLLLISLLLISLLLIGVPRLVRVVLPIIFAIAFGRLTGVVCLGALLGVVRVVFLVRLLLLPPAVVRRLVLIGIA